VIEFKRGVYQLALQELSRFIHRVDHPGSQRKNARATELAAPAPAPATTPTTESKPDSDEDKDNDDAK
jgi:hypothetical protein